MYLINFLAHLIRIAIVIALLNLILISTSTLDDRSLSVPSNTLDNLNKSNLNSTEFDSTYEFIKLNNTNSTDAEKKSENLHLITRIYRRLQEYHNRYAFIVNFKLLNY